MKNALAFMLASCVSLAAFAAGTGDVGSVDILQRAPGSCSDQAITAAEVLTIVNGSQVKRKLSTAVLINASTMTPIFRVSIITPFDHGRTVQKVYSVETNPGWGEAACVVTKIEKI